MLANACILWAASGAAAAAPTNDLSDAEIEGRRIVQKILEQRPAEPLVSTGVLRLRDAQGRRIEAPVACETTVTATNWRTVYSARGTNQDHAATLAIVHATDQPNEYRLRLHSGAPDEAGSWIRLTGNQTMVPFAGSDFWVADLGLEFFHWPAQRLLRKEVARTQSCYVLESTNPDPTAGYSRVVSWLDMDSVQESGQPAILQAEAYDSRNRRLKEFLPKDLKKVKGRWQLQEMNIWNEQTGSRTSLVFDLDK